MKKVHWLILGFLLVAVTVVVMVSGSGNRSAESLPYETADGAANSPKANNLELSSTTVQTARDDGAIAGNSGESPKPKTPHMPATPKVGTVQSVSGHSNNQTESVMEALKTRAHPERLSLMHPPKPFDQAAFEKDPDGYLNVVEPGRVFQTKQPAKDVPALKITGSGLYQVKQGGSVKLSATGAPMAPVTFTSTDLGAFAENNLNSVTVRADEQGLATVTFLATPGTMNDVNILAGSPLASGQARYVVEVVSK